MSHTPGPWEVNWWTVKRTSDSEPSPKSWRVIAESAIVCEVEGHNGTAEANGLLIAAAPDLLGALIKYHEWLEEHERLNMGPSGRTGYIGLDHRMGENVTGCDGCAAIAKAKGEA